VAQIFRWLDKPKVLPKHPCQDRRHPGVGPKRLYRPGSFFRLKVPQSTDLNDPVTALFMVRIVSGGCFLMMESDPIHFAALEAMLSATDPRENSPDPY
jgi:hypothetical protein